MEELVYLLTQGNPNIDALFIARLVVFCVSVEVFTVVVGLLASMGGRR